MEIYPSLPRVERELIAAFTTLYYVDTSEAFKEPNNLK